MTQAIANADLLPCPFCGSENIDPTGWASIDSKGPACDDCGASAGEISKDLADNITAWNTRTLTPPAAQAGEEPNWAVADAIVGHAWLEDGAEDLDGNPIWKAEVQCNQGDAIAAECWAGTEADALAMAETITRAIRNPSALSATTPQPDDVRGLEALGWAKAEAWHHYGIAWEHLERVSRDELLAAALDRLTAPQGEQS